MRFDSIRLHSDSVSGVSDQLGVIYGFFVGVSDEVTYRSYTLGPTTHRCREMDDNELERLAVEELLGEAKRGKERAETMGTYGWKKRNMTTNKRFLRNTLLGTLSKDSKPTTHVRNKETSARDTSKRHSSDDLHHDQIPKKRSLHAESSNSKMKHETSGTTSSPNGNNTIYQTRGFLPNLKSSEMKREQIWDKSRTSKVKTKEKT
ncbi:uncharacterized protein [Amphiura filiformis]|uniref:uncharacterized protein n=1 Tax=Amphiura filiformis TaxID=82378 RepID=UPI003B21DFCD